MSNNTITRTDVTNMPRTSHHKKMSFTAKLLKELEIVLGINIKAFSLSFLKSMIVLLISGYFLRAFDFNVLFQKGIATSLQDVEAHCLRFLFLPLALLVDFCKSCFEVFVVMFEEFHLALFANSSFELIILFILIMLSANSLCNKMIINKRKTKKEKNLRKIS